MIKLNIQRFADATQSITLTLRSQSYNPVRYVYFQVDQVGPQTFNWRIWNAKAAGSTYITAHQFHFWINGTEVWNMSGISGYSASGDYLGYSHHVFPVTIDSNGVSGTYTSPNIPDGFNITAKAGYDSASYVKESTVWFTCAKYNFTSQPSISVDSKDETSIRVKWSTSQTCNEIKWYNGNTLVATTNPNGTSGTYTFTGLTANTQYTLKGNFKRADSGYTMDSNTITPSTDNYPYVTTLNPQNITLGNATTQIINISNPHNRETTVYIRANDISGEILASGTTSSNMILFSINPNDLYEKIPNAQSGTLYYYCVYGNHTTTGITGTYRINGNERPIFPTANWSYVTNLTQLTNDNQIIIDGYSDVTITIDTPASSDYYASITGYYATWGSTTTPEPVLGDEPFTLSQGNGTSLVVLANDSRGLQSALQTSTLDITNKRVLYNKPVVNVLETHRLNGIDTTVTLNASGIMFNSTFGATGVQNAIDHVNYYVKPINSSTWSQAYPISLNNCTFDSTTGRWEIVNASIHQNGQSGGFPSGSSFNIKLEFYDAQGLLGYGTATSTIEDGTLARDVYKDYDGEYHEGINGLADGDYTQTIHGKVNVTGGYYLNGEPFEGGGGDTLPIGSIIDYDGNTVPDGYEEVTGKQYEAELIWTNSNGASHTTFDAQTVSFSSTYSYYDIIIAQDGSYLKTERVFTGDTSKYYLLSILVGGFIRIRDIVVYTDSIVFGTGKIYTSYGAQTTNNFQCVPYKIIGYKEV